MSNANADREKYGRYGDAVNILKEENEEDEQVSSKNLTRAGFTKVSSTGLKISNMVNANNINLESMQSNVCKSYL